MPVYTPPQSIDEVIDQLREITALTRQEGSRTGYFAALYLKVTIRIRDGIEQGIFEDGERMERFDVLFASRYLEALAQFQAGEAPTHCWQYAFDATDHWRPIVLQHLLLGINAHINLDLGIAAAQTSPGEQLPALKGDFDRVNATLAELVDGVQSDLAAIWPMLRLFNRYLGSVQEGLINFSIETARDAAWDLAQTLNATHSDDWGRVIRLKDREVTKLASVIGLRGPVGAAVTLGIRLGERGNVSDHIGLLLD